MAKVYFDERSRQTFPGSIKKLPLRYIRAKLYDPTVQRLIPFLGAGASLKTRSATDIAPPAKRPTAESLDRICAEFAIADLASRRFLDVAIQFAQLLAQRQALDDQVNRECAPSSWELARRLADLLVLDPLRPVGDKLKTLLREPVDQGDYGDIVRNVANLMELSRSVPQLLTVASYFNEGQNRDLLCDELLERFEGVKQVTAIQDRVIQVAKRFVQGQNASAESDKQDYLIVTTNYDPLIERQLKEQNVPTCVMTVDMNHRAVLAHVAPHTQQALGLSDETFEELKRLYEGDDAGAPADRKAFVHPRPVAKFSLTSKSHSLAMVYKIHGCPLIEQLQPSPPPPSRRVDNIVISDQDYVRFIQCNGEKNELVPAYAAERMITSSFLFLGYSFSDWNVRSLYRNFVTRRYRDDQEKRRDPDETSDRDYIVMRSYESADDYFFNQWNVSVLVTDLDDLASGLTPPEAAA